MPVQVRPYGRALQLTDAAGVQLLENDAAHSFYNCQKITYTCLDASSYELQAMGAALAASAAHFKHLATVNISIVPHR